MIEIEEIINNIPNEILTVGAIYKNPDLIVEYSQYIKSKYDFNDEATRFFYDCAVVIYETRSQKLDKTAVSTFMAETPERLKQYRDFKGWKVIEEWQKLSEPNNFKNYF